MQPIETGRVVRVQNKREGASSLSAMAVAVGGLQSRGVYMAIRQM